MSQDKAMPNWAFRGMAFMLKLMEPLKKPKARLEKVGLKRGQTVLEYGCGAGSFTIPAAQLVGPEGTVYATDIHPLSIETVEKRVKKAGLANVQTILTDRDTSLPDESVDVVLLYDMLHLVNDKQALLKELHRVLKVNGFLSADHEHTAKETFLQTMTSGQIFALQAENGSVFKFEKVERAQ